MRATPKAKATKPATCRTCGVVIDNPSNGWCWVHQTERLDFERVEAIKRGRDRFLRGGGE